MSIGKIQLPKLLLSIMIAFLLLATSTTVAFASAETNCNADGGVWNGIDADNGTCSYGSGDQPTKDNCRPFSSYQETFTAGALTSAKCVNSRGFGNGGDSTSNKDNSQSVTLRLYGKNGYATFAAGVCLPFQCTISANLPTGAEDALPDTTRLGVIYVRVTGSQSTPYRVCFNNPKAEKIAIFRYVGGSWIAITSPRITSTPVCANVSGDGAFYAGNG